MVVGKVGGVSELPTIPLPDARSSHEVASAFLGALTGVAGRRRPSQWAELVPCRPFDEPGRRKNFDGTDERVITLPYAVMLPHDCVKLLQSSVRWAEVSELLSSGAVCGDHVEIIQAGLTALA